MQSKDKASEMVQSEDYHKNQQILTTARANKQCPKLTPVRSPVTCKFIVGRVEITNVHARLASKILRTIS